MPSERFGSASAIHKRFLQWEQAGFFQALWRARLAEYEQLAGIAWRWQSIDEATIKAPPAQQAADPNPDRSGKNGGKRHVLAGGRGVPLSRIVSAANVNDCMRLSAVFKPFRSNAQTRRIDAASICAPMLATERPNIGRPSGRTVAHVVGGAKEAKPNGVIPTRRPGTSVVEVCRSWFNRFRKLLVR